MTLNGYEIRLEILKMAQGLVTEQWYKTCDAIQNTWDTKYNSPATATNIAEKEEPVGKLDFPPMPSSEDIIKKANELYAFIENDNSKSTTKKERGVCNGTGPGRVAGGRGQGNGRSRKGPLVT